LIVRPHPAPASKPAVVIAFAPLSESPEEFLTVAEVAAILKLNRQTVRNSIGRVARGRRYAKKELEFRCVSPLLRRTFWRDSAV
jgi:hypothetical protein